jgi:uncharacterized protein (UPF0548 family)
MRWRPPGRGGSSSAVFLATRPTRQVIDRFLAQSRALPFSYGPTGLTQGTPAGYNVDELVVAIGHGQADFERARAALATWQHFDIGWVRAVPAAPAPEPGTVVAVVIRHFGFWSLNGARVVYGVGDRERGTRFGFAYGTLMNHAEAGEELFEVFVNPASDEVMYRIRAASRPRAPLTYIGYPLVRFLQAACRRDSAHAMKLAVSAGGRT